MNTVAHIDLIQGASTISASPGFHTGVYFMAAALMQSSVWKHINPSEVLFIERLHLGMMPMAYAITHSAQTVWPQHTPSSSQSHKQWHYALLGVGVATVMTGGVGITGYYSGWLQKNGWGWHHHPPAKIIRSMTFLALAHAAVAYNEETLFRGHGFDVVRETFGPWIAGSTLIPLFAYAHTPRWRLIGYVAYGLTGINYTLMRYLSGNLMMPVACHFTWNWLQVAVIGADPHIPTFVSVSTPADRQSAWSGQWGKPSPGGVVLTFKAILALILAWLSWRKWRHHV